MKLAYIEKRFNDEHAAIIDRAEAVIQEYERQGYSLTLRQLYYQFVARGWLANKQREYDRLGGIISDARMAGLISWTAIEDRTRNLRGVRTFSGPAAALRQARATYRTDKWKSQPWRPEIWIEKDALVGVIDHVCAELGIDYFSCRGYNSQSEQWRAGRRFMEYYTKGQRPIVFHLGDHDPSGLDMTRDNRDRLAMFAGTEVQVVRLALNKDQIDRYNPPPNPTKLTDSRAEGYMAVYGDTCWELDALSPTVLGNLIRTSVLRLRDETLWNEALLEEQHDIQLLDNLIRELGDEE